MRLSINLDIECSHCGGKIGNTIRGASFAHNASYREREYVVKIIMGDGVVALALRGGGSIAAAASEDWVGDRKIYVEVIGLSGPRFVAGGGIGCGRGAVEIEGDLGYAFSVVDIGGRGGGCIGSALDGLGGGGFELVGIYFGADQYL